MGRLRPVRGNGNEAIAVLEQHHLDVELLFSKVPMPVPATASPWRGNFRRWPAISLVITSGRVTPGSGELLDGARFIGKPFSAETVHGHLREMIPEHRKPKSLKC